MEYTNFITKIAEQLDIEDITSLDRTQNFRELADWSSLSVMALIALYNDEFDKPITDVDKKKCSTIEDLFRLTME